VTDPRPRPAIAHASEAELARILDFYEVRWEYEPHCFPILFDRSGAVLESFSPDFFLPDLDLYVELTTLKQRLVRRKNRKLRRLRVLYPDLRVKLLYARDFRALLLKYGKLALADALTGAGGQATPPRVRTGDAGRRPVDGSQPAALVPGSAPSGASRGRPTRRPRRTRHEARALALVPALPDDGPGQLEPGVAE
jgi:hypothetical protein